MKDRKIEIPSFDLTSAISVSKQKNIADYTTPELNKLRKLCNFSKDEQEYFDLRSKGKSNISIYTNMCISESKMHEIRRKVESKIKRVS